jgi:hypothetical protein
LLFLPYASRELSALEAAAGEQAVLEKHPSDNLVRQS